MARRLYAHTLGRGSDRCRSKSSRGGSRWAKGLLSVTYSLKHTLSTVVRELHLRKVYCRSDEVSRLGYWRKEPPREHIQRIAAKRRLLVTTEDLARFGRVLGDVIGVGGSLIVDIGH